MSAAGGRTALGRRAEEAVAGWLEGRAYTILGPLELDVVARKGPLVVVVEVRVRGEGAYERPFESIGPMKQRRVLRAVARLWREKLAAMPEVQRVRIDVAAVRFEGDGALVDYVEGAIEPR